MAVEPKGSCSVHSTSPVKPKRRIPKTPCLLVFFVVIYLVKELPFNSFLSRSGGSRTRVKDGEEYMRVLHWKDAQMGARKQHMELVDMETEIETKSKREFVPIDTVHKHGYLHMGSWMVVLDTNVTFADAKILMMKRSPHVVTCRNFWSLLGEHSNRDENPEDIIIRGIQEELGDEFYRQFVKTGSKITRLIPQPVFYKQDYETQQGKRMDRQINYIYTVEMKTPVDVLENMLQVNNENVQVAWVTRNEIKRWLSFESDKRFCRNATRTVIQLVINQLDVLVLKQVPRSETKLASD